MWRSATTEASPTPTGPQPVVLAFAGDVHFADRTLNLLDDPATAFGPVSEIFQAADLAMVNLETAVTERGTPEPKTFKFRAPPSAYDAVKAAGIDIVSLANNHALDYGQVGLEDTISHAEAAAMPFVGVGRNSAEAYRPWITEIKGVRIAILGFSQVQELWQRWVATPDRPGMAYAMELENARAAVQGARALADVVIVYMHWGQEYNQCPTSAMKTFAGQMAEAGAHMIVGTHAHNLVGDGWLGSTFVQYGLSNFLWWRNDAGSNDTGVLKVHLLGPEIRRIEFVPAYIDRKTGQPIPSTGSELERIAAKYADLRTCTDLADVPNP
jgi:poly-gamma-glutamate synthesis protein (capsule biosynthesis protein)